MVMVMQESCICILVVLLVTGDAVLCSNLFIFNCFMCLISVQK